MNPSYTVTVVGTQRGQGTPDRQSFTVPCTFSERNGVYYLVYTEESGTRIMLKAEPTRVVMLRGNTRMLFHTARPEPCEYITEAGILSLEIHTERVSVHLGKSGGEIRLHYTIYYSGTPLSQNEILVTLRRLEN